MLIGNRVISTSSLAAIALTDDLILDYSMFYFYKSFIHRHIKFVEFFVSLNEIGQF